MAEASAGWAAAVEAACAARGLRLTPSRRRVLNVIDSAAAPLGAYAIVDAMARREGKPVAPPTIYRALDFLLEHGFLHKIESRNLFARCAHVGHAHQGIMLICERCGLSEEVEDVRLAEAARAAAAAAGFAIARLTVEAQGLCGRCALAQ